MKSTVVEIPAEAYGLNPQGGSALARFLTTDTEPGLGAHFPARWDELDIVGHWRRFLREPDSYFRHWLDG